MHFLDLCWDVRRIIYRLTIRDKRYGRLWIKCLMGVSKVLYTDIKQIGWKIRCNKKELAKLVGHYGRPALAGFYGDCRRNLYLAAIAAQKTSLVCYIRRHFEQESLTATIGISYISALSIYTASIK